MNLKPAPDRFSSWLPSQDNEEMPVMPQEIPRRIIQTAKHARLPLHQRAMVSNLSLQNPDYEYLFFDNEGVERFVDREFPQFRTVFDAFRYPIQRYDFFRYLAVYRYGGFYFDLDVLLASGLSGLLESGCVFPFEGLTFSRFLRDTHDMDWQIGNYAFGAAAGHPFLEAVIENCVRAQKDARWVEPMMRGMPRLSRAEFYILNTTGPGLLSRTLAETPALAQAVTVLFPDDVCDTGTWNRFGDLGVHMMDGSGRLHSGFLRRRLAQYWEVWTMRRLLRQSLALGRTRGGLPAKPIAARAVIQGSRA